MYRGNPQRSGEFFENIPNNTERQLYKYHHVINVASSPVIKNGILYFGNDSKKLIAMDLNSKEVLWEFKVPKEIKSTP